MNLPINIIVSVSALLQQAGISEYNTSNIALFSTDAYADSFGDLGYNIYFGPTQVGIDFGTTSQTFLQASEVFIQNPSILTNEGYLVIIPIQTAVQNLAFSDVAASGSFIFNYGGYYTTDIAWDDTASEIQSAIAALPGLSQVIVTGSIASQSLNIQFWGNYGVLSLATITSNTLLNGSSSAVNITVTTTTPGQTLGPAISASQGLVQYLGILQNFIPDQADTLAAAVVVQALPNMIFFVSQSQADVEPGGTLDLLRTGGFTQSRGLFYTGTASAALAMASAYASRGLSVDFSGSDTTLTMNLATLTGIQPDSAANLSALYTLCKNAGVDFYPAIAGDPSVISNGANQFFDNVYNLLWFSGAIQVAGFNYLKQTTTKIPQTEAGMDGLKGAYQNVCVQAITNQYLAPGTWTSAVPFGNPALFLAAISQYGYYIYSVPVSQQSPSDRALRKAPLVQIAIKTAGAIQSSNVIITVNE